MALKRMDNVGIVVEDLDRSIAFFVELGLELSVHPQTQAPSGSLKGSVSIE